MAAQKENIFTVKEGSAENTVLKEYVNLNIDILAKDIEHLKKVISYEKELVLVKEDAASKALVLQFKETERRLEALNHEAERLALMVPKEQFDIVVNQIRKELNDINILIKTIQLWISNQEGRAARSQIIAIAAVLVSIIAVILNLLKK